MHSQHFKSLPLVLRTYCQKPGQRYFQRYKTSENYSLIKKSKLKRYQFQEGDYKLYELINWLKNPQLYWLNRKNIYPSSKFNNNQNDELISIYQKFSLMKNLIKKIDIENKYWIDEIRKINIHKILIENGIIAPKNSIYTKESELS